MKEGLLMRLSNADAVVSKEGEVRAILREELSAYNDKITYGTLDSISFHKKGTAEKPLKIMFCVHMDEVGFLVRHISDIDFVYLIALGGVQQKNMEVQKVRITTANGSKVFGILSITTDENHYVRELYVDPGCDARKEVAVLSVEIGNMVCFDNNAHPFSRGRIYASRAMGDQSGCYVLAQAMKRLHELSLENEIILCATSSEEVGVHGGKTTVYKEDPDLIFALGAANHPKLSGNCISHHRLGKGCMLVRYDKTLVPNEKLLAFVKEIAQTHDIPYQRGMFSGRGTDASNAGTNRSGILAVVTEISFRYCHGSWSLVDTRDLEHTIKLVVQLAKALARERVEALTAYQRGENEMNQLEQEIIGMTSATGNGKAKVFEALKMVKGNRYDEVYELLAQARKIDLGAHRVQAKLITAETSDNDERLEIGLLMVYAQDHYMTSQLARDLTKEIISVFEAKEGK